MDVATVGRERRCARFIERIPIHFARRHALLGLTTDDPDTIEVLIDDPLRLPTVENLALTLDANIRTAIADREAILRAIDLAYQSQSADVQATVASMADDVVQVELEDRDDRDLLDNAQRAPVVKLVNQILFEASRRRASDVHVQPLESALVVRLRVDGVLHDYVEPGRHLLDEIISRIKIMGGMDIAEKRLPQDGRATVRIGARLIDLRISIVPTAHGERAVLRLLDKGARLFELDRLGMAADVRDRFESLIVRSHGLILVTGPTGSGKSTTLYAALQRVDSRRFNVVTLEDPIEYNLVGISQTQVAQRKGMNFATGLRSVLRQDPDVIMVGEIRDETTARLAIQAALTGHLVLSTLHTNDAPGAIARLIDLGIEPYLAADALLGVLAQRLVRLVCESCAQREVIPEDLARRMGIQPGDSFSRGRGCERCGRTGYFEREGIFEMLLVDDEIRALIHRRAAAATLRAEAINGGMRTLREDGVLKIRAGRTTPEEVLRVTQA